MYWHTSSCCPALSICRQSIMMHHHWYETCTCVCILHISPIVIVHPHQKSWKSAQQSSQYHWCSFGLGFTVTSHIPDFITTLISLYFMNINFFHICFSLDLLFLPVWEPFCGTLYHESVLTPALPPMHCIPIRALSMNWCCTQTSAFSPHGHCSPAASEISQISMVHGPSSRWSHPAHLLSMYVV